jgi:hypothetical protein
MNHCRNRLVDDRGKGAAMPAQRPQFNLAVENEILRQHQRVLVNLALDASDPIQLQTYLDNVVRRVAAALEIDHVKILRYRGSPQGLCAKARFQTRTENGA